MIRLRICIVDEFQIDYRERSAGAGVKELEYAEEMPWQSCDQILIISRYHWKCEL